MKKIDLHVHSSFSDGSCTPEELIAMAAAADLAALALTDHDTTGGLARFAEAARSFPGVEAVPGVEISTLYGSRELHLLGLWIDPENPRLAEFLARQRELRIERNEMMARKLASLGYPVDLEKLNPSGGIDSVGRPHFARFLAENHSFDSQQAVFEKLLKHSAPAFVPRQLPDVYSAIEVIRDSGGVPVWAHPVYRNRNERAFLKRMLKKFVPAGLGGMECYYSMFGRAETELTLEMAALFDIAPSGGSDFHGENGTVSMGSGAGGLFVPEELLAGLKARR